MSLIIVDGLDPDSAEVKLPETITFSVTLRDDEAEDESVSHTLVLGLAASNDLSFEPVVAGEPLTKERKFVRKIPAKARVFTFSETIHGKGEGLGGFRVSLDVPGTDGTGCLITLL